MPGPAPKHPSARARRNEVKKGFTLLPAGGRVGPIPVWPLRPNPVMVARREYLQDQIAQIQVQLESSEDGRERGRLRRSLTKAEIDHATLTLQIEQATDAEVALWDDLWRTPQATVWEEAHAAREVAQYVRWKILAEQGDLKAATEARQLSDRLGLNPLALTKLRLEIEHLEEVKDAGQLRRKRSRPRKSPGDPRGTLRAV